MKRNDTWVSFVSTSTLPDLEKKINDEICKLEEDGWAIKDVKFQVTANFYYAVLICK